jgi:hypothetical protein
MESAEIGSAARALATERELVIWESGAGLRAKKTCAFWP